MTIEQLQETLAQLHAGILAKGHAAAVVSLEIGYQNGFSFVTWVHVMDEKSRSVGAAHRRYVASFEEAIQALHDDVADFPPKTTDADLAPWFEPTCRGAP